MTSALGIGVVRFEPEALPLTDNSSSWTEFCSALRALGQNPTSGLGNLGASRGAVPVH